MNAQEPLWTPSRQSVDAAVVTDFARHCSERYGADVADYDRLHAWSITERAQFWDAIWDFCGVKGDKGGTLLDNGDAMPGARFFPEARLNFAENLLSVTGAQDAIVFRGEDKVQTRMSWDQLHA